MPPSNSELETIYYVGIESRLSTCPTPTYVTRWNVISSNEEDRDN